MPEYGPIKIKKAPDILYVKTLAAPFTVNTMPEGTLKTLSTHTDLGDIMATDGGDCEKILSEFAKAGVDIDALAARLQDEGAKSFVGSWNDLKTLPEGCRAGDNANAFLGGFRLWEGERPQQTRREKALSVVRKKSGPGPNRGT